MGHKKSFLTAPGRLAGVKTLAVAVKMAATPGGPHVTQRLAAIPRMAKAVASGEFREVSTTQLGLLVAAAAYIASPVDLIPEAVLGVVGLADDAVVITWFGGALVRATDQFLAWEKIHSTTVEGQRVR